MSKMSLLSDGLMLFAQTAAPAPAAGGAAPGGMPTGILIFYACIFGAMYFFLFAPQQKKRKELEKKIAALQTGDDIITTGGIYGTITNVKDDRFVVRVSDNTKIELGKGFVATVVKKTDEK
jgi:preprotein translocase subunit YajC